MCYELMYSKRAATKEGRKSEPRAVTEAPPQIKVEERAGKIAEPA